jgi:hypothetical protein
LSFQPTDILVKVIDVVTYSRKGSVVLEKVLLIEINQLGGVWNGGGFMNVLKRVCGNQMLIEGILAKLTERCQVPGRVVFAGEVGDITGNNVGG